MREEVWAHLRRLLTVSLKLQPPKTHSLLWRPERMAVSQRRTGALRLLRLEPLLSTRELLDSSLERSMAALKLLRGCRCEVEEMVVRDEPTLRRLVWDIWRFKLTWRRPCAAWAAAAMVPLWEGWAAMGRDSSETWWQLEERQEERKEAKVAVDWVESRLLALLRTMVVG